jgi:hypothetical protein
VQPQWPLAKWLWVCEASRSLPVVSFPRAPSGKTQLGWFTQTCVEKEPLPSGSIKVYPMHENGKPIEGNTSDFAWTDFRQRERVDGDYVTPESHPARIRSAISRVSSHEFPMFGHHQFGVMASAALTTNPTASRQSIRISTVRIRYLRLVRAVLHKRHREPGPRCRAPTDYGMVRAANVTPRHRLRKRARSLL